MLITETVRQWGLTEKYKWRDLEEVEKVGEIIRSRMTTVLIISSYFYVLLTDDVLKGG